MKIAFPTRNNESVSRHFGKMTHMVIIEVVDGVESGREHHDMSEMPMCGGGNHARPDFIVGVLDDCDVLIANGIGAPLADRIRKEGIEVVLTRTHTIDGALAAYLNGTISHDPILAHPTRH